MNEFRDITSSILRFVALFCESRVNMIPINLDGFANPGAWPAQDFIGTAEFQMDTDGKFTTVTQAFIISTREDQNLFRMNDVINDFLPLLLVGNRIEVVDGKSAVSRGHLNITGSTRVGSVEQTIAQPARPIFVTMRSDRPLR